MAKKIFTPETLKDCIRTIAVLRNEIHTLNVRIAKLEREGLAVLLIEEKERREIQEQIDDDIPF